MTLIEFFDKTPFENLISSLTAKPKKVIFLGERSQMNKVMPDYEKFLRKKWINTKIECRGIKKNDLQAIVDTLTEIIKTERNCVFDITGGEDLAILACGIVYATLREQYPFKLQRFNLRTGRIVDCDGDGEVSFEGTFSVTVEELIALYGGVVLSDNLQLDADSDKRDVDYLWNMACSNLRGWNDAVKYLNEFEKRTQPEEDRMNIDIDLAPLSAEIYDYHHKLKIYVDFVQKMVEKGFVTDFWLGQNHISYCYKNAVARRCLKSPGDILEVKVLAEAMSLQENGKPYFDSCHIGVNIDWDGVDRHADDTRNEIDVILMRGLTPIFISCKIGEIKEIEPYKLWTVAERFGGKNVKKVLIASDFKRDNEKSENSFLNRAKEMGITFIANATEMTPTQWKNVFKNMV